jgi:hypothetical protein
MAPPLDAAARKQLLLTRIAMERADWVRDVQAVRRRLTVPELLAGLMHRAGGGGLASVILGHRGDGAAEPAGWAGRVMSIALMLRRHPLWWPLIAGVLPWFRGRARPSAQRPSRGKGKLLVAALAAGAAATAWWLGRGRGADRDEAGR